MSAAPAALTAGAASLQSVCGQTAQGFATCCKSREREPVGLPLGKPLPHGRGSLQKSPRDPPLSCSAGTVLATIDRQTLSSCRGGCPYRPRELMRTSLLRIPRLRAAAAIIPLLTVFVVGCAPT